MNYEVVFDVRQIWFDMPLVAVLIPLAMLAVTVPVLRAYRRGFRYGKSKYEGLTYYFLVIFPALWLVVAVTGVVWGHNALAEHLKDGSYTVVEGPIQGYAREMDRGTMAETFVVAGHPFYCSPLSGNGGYRPDTGEPGLLGDGVQVRIAEVDGIILRIEVDRSSLRNIHLASGAPSIDKRPYRTTGKHLWILPLAGTLVVGWILLWRCWSNAVHRASGRSSYRRYILSPMHLVILPWIIMGLGLEMGFVSAMWEYFYRFSNPWVLAFHFSIAAVFAIVAVWLVKTRSVVALRYLSAVNQALNRPEAVWLFYLAALAGFVVSEVMYVTDGARIADTFRSP